LFAASALWLIFRPPPRASQFALFFGIAETAVLGSFLAQDLGLFVLFFDLMLVPFYFLVGIWGGPDRIAAAVKMVVYTLVGSLIMLAAAAATAVLSARGPAELSFAFSDLVANRLPESTQKWVFAAFALAFLIKMPAFPFHGWMPDAYRAMPLPALAVFSGVVSKVAAYGFLRVTLPLFPDAVNDFQTILLVLALLSILYGSVMAFTQTNTRLILGYSSVAQLGFITLGLFAADNAAAGAQGALMQSIQHGLVVAPMLLVIVLLAERSAGSEDIRDMGGIAFRAPVLAGLFLIATLATLAMPGSANFVGELLVLFGSFEDKLVYGLVASVGVVLAAVYMIRLFQRTMHNPPGPAVEAREADALNLVAIAPLVAVIVALGVYPNFVVHRTERATTNAIAETIGQAPELSGFLPNATPTFTLCGVGKYTDCTTTGDGCAVRSMTCRSCWPSLDFACSWMPYPLLTAIR